MRILSVPAAWISPEYTGIATWPKSPVPSRDSADEPLLVSRPWDRCGARIGADISRAGLVSGTLDKDSRCHRTVVARWMAGLVKTSVSSLLWLENSETIAPCGPD